MLNEVQRKVISLYDQIKNEGLRLIFYKGWGGLQYQILSCRYHLMAVLLKSTESQMVCLNIFGWIPTKMYNLEEIIQ